MSFPPTEFGDTADATTELCKHSKYILYCNSIVPRSERLQHWYQFLNISLAGAAILLYTLLCAFPYLRRIWRRWQERSKRSGDSEARKPSTSAGTGWNGVSMPVLNPRGTNSGLEMDRSPSTLSFAHNRSSSAMSLGQGLPDRAISSFSMRHPERNQSSMSIRELCDDERRTPLPITEPHWGPERSEKLPSFLRPDYSSSMQSLDLHRMVDPDIKFNPLQNFDLRIAPLFANTGGKEARFSTTSRPSSPTGTRSGPRKTCVGLVDLQDLGPEALDSEELPETVNELNMLRIEKGLAGLVLRAHDNISLPRIMELLDVLFQHKIGVMLMCDTDAVLLKSIDFGLLIGIILENSTILGNGQRRDFFQSDRLRAVMDKCASARVERPSFFLGFNDLWEMRPTAAVVRRAFKLAEFFGATLTHGPVNRIGSHEVPISLSGFDYLKGPQIVDVSTKVTYPSLNPPMLISNQHSCKLHGSTRRRE
jgi:hypothetical protein